MQASHTRTREGALTTDTSQNAGQPLLRGGSQGEHSPLKGEKRSNKVANRSADPTRCEGVRRPPSVSTGNWASVPPPPAPQCPLRGSRDCSRAPMGTRPPALRRMAVTMKRALLAAVPHPLSGARRPRRCRRPPPPPPPLPFDGGPRGPPRGRLCTTCCGRHGVKKPVAPPLSRLLLTPHPPTVAPPPPSLLEIQGTALPNLPTWGGGGGSGNDAGSRKPGPRQTAESSPVGMCREGQAEGPPSPRN